ncbi:MAG: hypothetical protein IK065_01610 [Neisseriaceae bacterium]|nr:hypothetical protein [Neisseriaceae bacterium]
MKKYVYLGLLSLCVAAPFANGAVYECKHNGVTTYTNKAGSGCSSAKLGYVGTYSADHKAYADSASYSYTPPSSSSSGNSPKRNTRSGTAAEHVQPEVQSKRDNGRLSILQRELANEQQALDSAQKNLAAGKAAKKDAASLAALEGAIKDRQENISALQKEISRM